MFLTLRNENHMGNGISNGFSLEFKRLARMRGLKACFAGKTSLFGHFSPHILQSPTETEILMSRNIRVLVEFRFRPLHCLFPGIFSSCANFPGSQQPSFGFLCAPRVPLHCYQPNSSWFATIFLYLTTIRNFGFSPRLRVTTLKFPPFLRKFSVQSAFIRADPR
jgi:hypothetical protein